MCLTQLKITEELTALSLLEAVWMCVLMFCEWTESGPLCQRCGDQAIQSWSALAAVPRDSSSPLFLHSPARSAFSLHLLLPWLQWFHRGCITVAPSLSLCLPPVSVCLSFHPHHVKKDDLVLLPNCGHSLKKTFLICKYLHWTKFFYLKQFFILLTARLALFKFRNLWLMTKTCYNPEAHRTCTYIYIYINLNCMSYIVHIRVAQGSDTENNPLSIFSESIEYSCILCHIMCTISHKLLCNSMKAFNSQIKY